jgi:oligopeptide transport system substrate-binding protein
LKRVLGAAADSPGAGLLYDVKGARAFHREEGGVEGLGVRALDEVTLVMELEGPTSYFPHLLAHDVTYPVPQHVVEAHGEAWTEVGNIVTNGPFKLEAWDRGKSMVLVRNPEYHGRFRGNVQWVELSLLADPSARLEMYEANGLDVLDMTFFPPTELDDARQRHAGEYVTGPRLWTSYVEFDVSQPPFDDVRVRRAFVLATDKETLADVVLRGRDSPATGGFIPPGMPGHSAEIGLPYDPDRARQFLAEAGYPGGRGFPVIDLLTRRVHQSQSEYLQAQWRENLKVEVKIIWETMEYGRLRERLHREPPSMYLHGWIADYPDPDNFLRISTSQHWARWQNEAYERLVEKARRAMDQEERIELYRQADRVLVEEAAIMPLYHSWQHLLVKPWVRMYPTSALKSWFWKDVIIELH